MFGYTRVTSGLGGRRTVVQDPCGWWTRNDSIRTLARMLISADLLAVSDPPRYQTIALQAVELRELGYPDTLIAECTGVTPKTVAKAIRWFQNRPSVID